MKQFLLHLAYGKPRCASPPFYPQNVRKVLLIRRNGFGDMICTLPLIRAIHQHYPNWKIHVLAGEKSGILLEDIQCVETVYPYYRKRRLFRNHYLNLPHLLKPIRRENFDLLIAVKGGFSSLLAIIAYATGIPWRLGFSPPPGHSLNFCLNLTVPKLHVNEHQIETCLRLLNPLGIPPPENPDLHLPIHSKYRDPILLFLKKAGLKDRKFALINISSERHESRWLPEAIAQLASHLDHHHQLPVVLCGLTTDRSLASRCRKMAPQAIRALVFPPSILHFAALTQQSFFLICGDGGPMHVAAAVKTPTFVLFSGTNPKIWRPYKTPFEYVQTGQTVSEIPAELVIEKITPWIKKISEIDNSP